MPERQIKVIPALSRAERTRKTTNRPIRVASQADLRSEIAQGKTKMTVIPQAQAPVKIAATAPVEVKKLRVAGYCRVSTGTTQQETSIVAQREHYEEYIKSHPDWEFAGIYWEAAVSGTKKENRPELQRLIAACKAGSVDLILTKSISRFSRNTTDCLEMVRTLTALGVNILFEKENIHTGTMESEFLLTLFSTFAEEESKSISANELWTKHKQFENGTFRYSTAPFGYNLVDGTFEVNPERAPIVREIFDAVLAGKGTPTIAKELNARGIPTGTKRNDGSPGVWTAYNGTFVMEGGSIKTCEAMNGGGVYVQAGKTMEMRGANTSITNNNATVKGGGIATGAGNKDETTLSFGGKVRIENNKLINDLKNKECNVQLSADRNDLIYADHLSSGAHIGVYVEPDEEELFSKHGEANRPFATYLNKTDEKYLYCFTNDCLGMKGGLLPDGGDPNTVYWVKIFSLRVVLNILSDTPSDKEDTFHYKVTLKNPDGTLAENIYGFFGEEETRMYFDKGVATFDLTGETGKNYLEADELPEGLLYTVEQIGEATNKAGQKKDGYYTVSPGTVISGVIGENNNNGTTLATKYLSTATFNNIHAVCKIRGGDYGLLYYKTGKTFRPAVYSELNLAFSDINRANLYYLMSDGINYMKYPENTYSVEMLVQNYSISQSATLGGKAISAERTVTLTTASSDASIDGYPYSGQDTAVIKRASSFELSLIQVKDNGKLTLEDITLDGNGDVQTATMSGGLVYVHEKGDLTISNDATLQNSKCSMTGAAIYAAENAKLQMNAGTIKDNSVTENGTCAGIYLSQGSELRLSGELNFSNNFVDGTTDKKNGNAPYPMYFGMVLKESVR